eukprot:gene40661-58626_t
MVQVAAAGEESELPFALHPLQFRVQGSVLLGCVVGNGGILFLCVVAYHVMERAVAPVVAPLMGKRPAEVSAMLQIPGNFFTIA